MRLYWFEWFTQLVQMSANVDPGHLFSILQYSFTEHDTLIAGVNINTANFMRPGMKTLSEMNMTTRFRHFSTNVYMRCRRLIITSRKSGLSTDRGEPEDIWHRRQFKDSVRWPPTALQTAELDEKSRFNYVHALRCTHIIAPMQTDRQRNARVRNRIWRR